MSSAHALVTNQQSRTRLTSSTPPSPSEIPQRPLEMPQRRATAAPPLVRPPASAFLSPTHLAVAGKARSTQLTIAVVRLKCRRLLLAKNPYQRKQREYRLRGCWRRILALGWKCFQGMVGAGRVGGGRSLLLEVELGISCGGCCERLRCTTAVFPTAR